MDQGVIRAFKALYRRWLLTHIIQKMESACSVTELTKLITVLQAIYWIDRAWGDTKESTIQKCFRRCGFVQEEPEVDEEEEDTTDHVLLQDMINHVTGGGTDITEEDYLAMDDDLPTEDNTDQWEQNLLETIMEHEDDDSTTAETDTTSTLTYEKMLHMFEEIKEFALTKDEDYISIVPFINMTEDKLLKKRMLQKKQVSMSSYLSKT